MTDRIPLDRMTSDDLDRLYDLLDKRWERIIRQSHQLQELKRDNFELRMDIVALLEGITVSQVEPGRISTARKKNR
jgi:hypothetical protein